MALSSFQRTALVAFLVGFVSLLAAACGEDDGGGIEIREVRARATTNNVSAVYLQIENDGPADRLVSASTPLTSNVQLHNVITEGASQVMRRVEGGIEVPADGRLELKPGSYHVMLLDLKEPLKEGDSFDLDLKFEKAGTKTVKVGVKALTDTLEVGGTMDHGK